MTCLRNSAVIGVNFHPFSIGVIVNVLKTSISGVNGYFMRCYITAMQNT